ncbi:MAG TPA: 16S rRNA (adenine(1518)-N(6)/adenine(1519)-N(6))-dimethyltransferase RsmA [Thermotogota bacterium]|nr:16S rRNA (adenine(1518)-N(6)/adenine(1519)-N(6))-dimethyltransferase RsmA [Thermotogota bacterium]HRW93063.1 16S rRNA (adenine(1518)-N(6)/adenine(1519)-N(6))-dimethyltransferase RsmA [Thermotogota bacterium]
MASNPGDKTSWYLKRYGIVLKKSLGQNFLSNAQVAQRIVAAAEVVPGESVLEIGAGAGTLTESLLQAGAGVVAVEIDSRLAVVLRERFKQQPSFELVLKDFMKLSPDELPGTPPRKTVSNLPYQVGTAMLSRLWKQWGSVEQMVVMLQKEVAQKLVAQPSTQGYGSLTLLAGFFCEVTQLFTVSSGHFVPNPKVESSVVRLVRKAHTPVPKDRWEDWETFVFQAFHNRRKMLKNNFSPPAQMERLLETRGLSPRCRAEELDLEQMVGLFQAWETAPSE